MQKFSVRHETTYTYRESVSFGDHRLMLRPRDSHDLRLLNAHIAIEPAGSLRWLLDVFGNSVAIASFTQPGNVLRVIADLVIARFPKTGDAFPIENYARKIPFSYPLTEMPDLGRTNERHYMDPERVVTDWTRRLLEHPDVNADTVAFLQMLTNRIQQDFIYQERHEPGVQTPLETLQTMSGTCRDYAVFMMEAVRSFGLAARFVSGYLYDPGIDGAPSDTMGAGATHAWVQVYLPGAGWIDFDPTNGGTGGQNLIPVAVAREPTQAVPISGTYSGNPNAFVEMSVDVSVRSLGMSPALD